MPPRGPLPRRAGVRAAPVVRPCVAEHEGAPGVGRERTPKLVRRYVAAEGQELTVILAVGEFGDAWDLVAVDCDRDTRARLADGDGPSGRPERSCGSRLWLWIRRLRRRTFSWWHGESPFLREVEC